MEAECIKAFKDAESGVMREVGDRFEVTPERLKAINSTSYGQLVAEVEKKAVRRTRGTKVATEE